MEQKLIVVTKSGKTGGENVMGTKKASYLGQQKRQQKSRQSND